LVRQKLKGRVQGTLVSSQKKKGRGRCSEKSKADFTED